MAKSGGICPICLEQRACRNPVTQYGDQIAHLTCAFNQDSDQYYDQMKEFICWKQKSYKEIPNGNS